MGLSVLIALAIVAKPALWIRDNTELALASTRKFDMGGGGSAIGSALSGTVSFLVALILFLALAVVVVALFDRFFRAEETDGSQTDTLLFRFLARTVVTAAFITLVVVVLSGTTNVKDRWLQPVLVLAVPAMVLWLAPRISVAGQRWFGTLIACLAAVVIVALPVNILYGTPDRPSYRSAPFPALVDRIEKDYVGENRIFTENGWIAGNIAFLRPHWTIVTPNRLRDTMESEDEFVMVWWPDFERVAENAREAVKNASGKTLTLSDEQTFSHGYLMHSKKFQVGLARVRLGAAD
jgi:hypothetical protein